MWLSSFICECMRVYVCICRAIKSRISIFIYKCTHRNIYGNFDTYIFCATCMVLLGCTWFITSWWCICWHLLRRSRHRNDNDIRNESRRYTSWIKKVLLLRCYLSSCRVFRLHSFRTSQLFVYFNASSVRYVFFCSLWPFNFRRSLILSIFPSHIQLSKHILPLPSCLFLVFPFSLAHSFSTVSLFDLFIRFELTNSFYLIWL